jgi:hypothetical protein
MSLWVDTRLSILNNRIVFVEPLEEVQKYRSTAALYSNASGIDSSGVSYMSKPVLVPVQ